MRTISSKLNALLMVVFSLMLAAIKYPCLAMVGAALSASVNTPRKHGEIQSYPVADNVHIYKGAHVCVNASGYAQPATDASSVKYLGIAYEEADNTVTGHADAFIDVRVEIEGRFLLVATGMAQTSIGKFCYITDDSAVALTSTYGVCVGKIEEYVSATSVWVELKRDIGFFTDPASRFLGMTTKVDDYTVLVADSGKTFAIATDAKKFTLPSTAAGLRYTFVNTEATDGAAILTISPAAADMISGGGLGLGVDDKDLINTKATSKKYDYVTLVGDGAAGWIVEELVGVWAKE